MTSNNHQNYSLRHNQTLPLETFSYQGQWLLSQIQRFPLQPDDVIRKGEKQKVSSTGNTGSIIGTRPQPLLLRVPTLGSKGPYCFKLSSTCLQAQFGSWPKRILGPQPNMLAQRASYTCTLSSVLIPVLCSWGPEHTWYSSFCQWKQQQQCYFTH